MARVLPLQGFRPSKGVVVSIIVQPEQMEKSTLHFNRKFFATRKSNPVQKISHLHFHTSGYYFCGPGGIRTHNQQNRNLSFYPVELRNQCSKDTNQDVINSFCLTPAPNPESAAADLPSRYKPESYSMAIANSNLRKRAMRIQAVSMIRVRPNL